MFWFSSHSGHRVIIANSDWLVLRQERNSARLRRFTFFSPRIRVPFGFIDHWLYMVCECVCVCVYGKSKVSHGKLQLIVELCPLPGLVAELSSKFVPWVFRFATRAAFKCDLGRKCDYFIKRFGNVASVHKLQTHRREVTQSLSDDWALSNIIGFAYESRWKVVPVCHAAVDAAL